MARTQLFADPKNSFLHDVILATCRRHSTKIALVDTSVHSASLSSASFSSASSNGASSARRFTYAEYGETVERLARGLVAAGLRPGEVVAVCLPNSWEFAVTYHAATLAGGIPTPMNPVYREREIRFQLENSGAVFFVADGPILQGINLGGLPALRRVFTTRSPASGAEDFANLLKPATAPVPEIRCV